ncbi:MAG: LacI family transcriptional regulator [Pseudonocardia sp. SCN 72-86]|nr:MAG: LacI family transcriptional regulator [Pseudonocardia sp. SCN 72-86]
MSTGDSADAGQRPPRLREIAEAAGVHVSTVSRVLRQAEPPEGWSDMALRIRETAERLGYQRNFVAASLRTRRTRTLGVVIPRLTDGVIATMFQGAEEAAREAGYSVLMSSPPDEPAAQRAAIELLVSRQIDGLMLSSLHRDGAAAFLASLRLGQVPLLLFNRHGDVDRVSVTCDDRTGGRLAGEHLIGLGHRRLGVVGGPAHASTANDRVVGFLEAAREAGVTVPEAHVVRSRFGVAAGVEAARAMLGSAEPPTALFCVDDTSAVGVLGVARDLGLDVPGDLSVVGYNDVPIVAQLPVPLTTVRSPAQEMGRTAVGALLRLVAGGRVETTRLPVELVARASTAPPPVGAPRQRPKVTAPATR